MPKKSGLGRGLEALFNDNTTERQQAIEVPLSEIEPNRDQPRKNFDPKALSELGANIAQYGLLQPLVVRPLPGGGYQIVAGERRWRACREAGLTTVPVVVKELDDAQTMEIALIENLQREDLNPMEEAEGYRRLMDVFGLTQEQVSERVGKSRPAVANALRLLELGEWSDLVRDGKISAGHGRALLSFAPGEERDQAAKAAMEGASVRALEEMSRRMHRTTGPKSNVSSKRRDPYFEEAQLALEEALGRKVRVTFEKSRGTLSIEFYSKEDLSGLLNTLFDKNSTN